MKGVKYDDDKPDLRLLPPLAIFEVGKVLTFGAKKYAPWNWKKLKKERHLSAALRHIFQYMSGEKIDESGLPHLAHAITDLMFVLELELGERNEQNET